MSNLNEISVLVDPDIDDNFDDDRKVIVKLKEFNAFLANKNYSCSCGIWKHEALQSDADYFKFIPGMIDGQTVVYCKTYDLLLELMLSVSVEKEFNFGNEQWTKN